jgi:diketogulonate reductase-like aldo/keto reductase
MLESLSSTIDLGRGVVMPRLGFGTFRIPPGPETEHAVEFALRHGYRGVDTASLYANEEGVGAGLRASGVAREEVFLTTKVANAEQGDPGPVRALEQSLARLGTDYVDLYLVHWPMRAHFEATWRAMEEVLASGRARAIGVCNFLPHHLDTLLSFADVAPAVDQVEFHPWLQQPALQTFVAEHDIVLQAWAPVMKGRVGEVPELVDIAKAHDVTPAQVAIRWILQQGYTTIPKSVHEARILENSDVFGFALSDPDLERIWALDRNERLGPDPDSYAW